MIGDGSQASFQHVSEDPTRLYTGCNSKASCAAAAPPAAWSRRERAERELEPRRRKPNARRRLARQRLKGLDR